MVLSSMDILKMLAELRAERAKIEQAILVVERLAAATRGSRRGRPPKWVAAAQAAGPAMVATKKVEPKKKRLLSAPARKRMTQAT
jgi:hypothetical protein